MQYGEVPIMKVYVTIHQEQNERDTIILHGAYTDEREANDRLAEINIDESIKARYRPVKYIIEVDLTE